LTSAGQTTQSADRRGAGRSRMCAVTREVRPEAELIRFVAAPDATVVPDLRAKLPGRGIWLSLDRRSVDEAVRRNIFARALKAPLRPADDLADQVATRLNEVALGRLGLARKAGAAVAGFAKVEAAIARENLLAVVVAAEAAEDGRRKIAQALRRRFGDSGAVPVFRHFTGADLGLAIGRPDVIHAAVLQSPAGKSFVEAARRFQRYEGIGAQPIAGKSTDTADDPQDVKNE
jgi:predicted RNA-binding protein YlxR (DUF448 family)/ribosomal protein L30E